MLEKQDRRYSGRIKWFHADKGYGFIASDEFVSPTSAQGDVFVHQRALAPGDEVRMKPGAAVTFAVQQHRGRHIAAEVTLVS